MVVKSRRFDFIKTMFKTSHSISSCKLFTPASRETETRCSGWLARCRPARPPRSRRGCPGCQTAHTKKEKESWDQCRGCARWACCRTLAWPVHPGLSWNIQFGFYFITNFFKVWTEQGLSEHQWIWKGNSKHWDESTREGLLGHFPEDFSLVTDIRSQCFISQTSTFLHHWSFFHE